MNSTVWMDRALALARRRQGLTAPNPPVGAVLVKNGQVIGEGFHHGPGHAHAEVAALEDARSRGFDPKGAVLYVTLEPCCHQGPGKRTPPCAQRLVREGVSEVFAAAPDPNPAVCGRGMELLARSGVTVHWGPGEREAKDLIADFSAWVGARRPFITLKWAQSLDGRTSNRGGPRWITGEEARNHSHVLRAEHDAVAIGAGTLRDDDPLLTVRVPLPEGRTFPRRLIFAGTRPLPESAQVFTDADRERTWIVADPQGAVWDQARRLSPERVLAWDGVDGAALGEGLLGAGFYRVFIEGGPRLLRYFHGAGMWDRVAIFIAPLWLKGILPQTAESGEPMSLDRPQWSTWGRDVCLDGWNPASPAVRGQCPEGENLCSPV